MILFNHANFLFNNIHWFNPKIVIKLLLFKLLGDGMAFSPVDSTNKHSQRLYSVAR
jgi:hypothetical protein